MQRLPGRPGLLDSWRSPRRAVISLFLFSAWNTLLSPHACNPLQWQHLSRFPTSIFPFIQPCMVDQFSNSSVRLSIHPPVHQFIRQSINSSASPSIHPPVHQFIRQFINSSVSSSIHPPVHQFIRPFINASIHSITNPFVTLCHYAASLIDCNQSIHSLSIYPSTNP